MATYALYKFNLSTGSGHLFNDEVREKETLENAQVYFGELFHKNMFLYKKKNEVEKIKYTCNVLSYHNDVIILRLFDEKTIKYWEKEDSAQHNRPNNPYCHIIIDNRSGIGQLLIERTEAFNYKTDEVRDIFQDYLRKKLWDHKLTIDIIAKMRAGDFWDIVEEQQRKYNDRITKITFSFPNPATTTPIDAPIAMTNKLNALASMTKMFRATKGTLSVDAAGENSLRLERTKKDMAQMVVLCAQNGYDLSVKFKEFGLYRINHDIKVYHTILPSITQDFINQQEILDYTKRGQFALLNTLDSIRKQIANYSDETPIIKKPKRHRSKSIR